MSGLNKTSLALPSLLTLSEDDFVELTEGITEQTIKTQDFKSLLSLSEQEKNNLSINRPVSLYDLKNKIQNILVQKSKNNLIFEKINFDIGNVNIIMATRYIIRFDDITPGMAWSKFLPFKEMLEKNGIKSLLGVVPESRDHKLEVEDVRKDFFELVRSWALYGDSIAQHGMYHCYDSNSAGILTINPRSEFAGHSYEDQLNRIRKGKDILIDEGVWQPWFMPEKLSRT